MPPDLSAIPDAPPAPAAGASPPPDQNQNTQRVAPNFSSIPNAPDFSGLLDAPPSPEQLEQQRVQHLAQAREGTIDTGIKDLFDTELEQQGGKGFYERFWDQAKNIPKAYYDAADAAHNYLFNKLPQQVQEARANPQEWMPHLANSDEYAKNLAAPLPVQGAMPLATGAAKFVIGGGADLTSAIKNAVEMPPGFFGEEVTPEEKKAYAESQAMNSATADQINAWLGRGTREMAKATGQDPDALYYQGLEQVAPFLLPVGGEFAGPERVAAAISRANEMGIPIAKWALAHAPEAATMGVAHEAAKTLGIPSSWLSTAVEAGIGQKFTPKALSNKIVTAVFGQDKATLAQNIRVAMEAPNGVRAVEWATKPVADEVNKLNLQISNWTQTLKPEDLADLNALTPDGEFLYSADDLSGRAKQIRLKQDQVADLSDKLQTMTAQSGFHKWTNAAASYAANMAANTAVAAGIGGLYGATTAPTGEGAQGFASGSMYGAGLGMAFSPLAAYSGMHQLRLARGRQALTEMGSRGFDLGSLDGVPDYLRNSTLMANGYAHTLGGEIKVVDPAKSPNWPGAVPQGAPAGTAAMPANGFISPDGKTLNLNKNALGEGTAFHELRHLMQRFTGQMLREKAPDVMLPFEEAYADASGNPNFDRQSEMDAEIGRIAMSYTPIEAFYGGETPGDQLSRIARGIVNHFVPDRVKYDPTLNVPYTRADIESIRSQMFKLGERAQAQRFVEPVLDTGAGGGAGGGGGRPPVPPVTPPPTPPGPQPPQPPQGPQAAPPVQHPDYADVRAQAEDAMRQKLGTSKAKDVEQRIGQAGIVAAAQAHAKAVGPDSDLITWRTDKYGKSSITGKRADMNDPFHQMLIERAKKGTLTPEGVQNLNDLEANLGRAIAVDYSHAPEDVGTQEVTRGARKEERAAATAPERVAAEAARAKLTKSYVPTAITYHPKANAFVVNGFSPDKFFNNANTVIDWATKNGIKTYSGVNDPLLVQHTQHLTDNHQNGFTGGGKPIKGTSLTPVTQTPGYKPHVIPRDYLDQLNVMMGNDTARTGKKGLSPEQAEKQALAKANSPYFDPTTGETNRFRERLGTEAEKLEPVYETLRPELIDRVRQEPVEDTQTLRPSGFTGDRGQLGLRGLPRQEFVAAGFMPHTETPQAYLGNVTDDGVKGVMAGIQNLAGRQIFDHESAGLTRGKQWRYNPYENDVTWYGGRPNEAEMSDVDAWLSKRGIEPESHQDQSAYYGAQYMPGTRKTPQQLDADIGRTADEGSDVVASTPESETIKLGINQQQIMALVGPQMYSKPIGEVAVKELLQNAFDTSRTAGATINNPKRIEINTDRAERTITVKDSGRGMTPQIIQDAFFTIGGTHKEGDPANNSGGLGLAKMAFILGSDHIRLETVRDGIKSIVDAPSEQIRNSSFKIQKEKTNEPNGTSVTVRIPEDYVNANGETKAIYFDERPDFLDKPLIGPVEVALNGEVLPTGVHQTKWQRDNTFNFSWGKIHVYVDPTKVKYPKFDVLSAGLHQFEVNKYEVYGFGGADEETVMPYNFVLDVRPKVKTDNAAYPFNNQREGFRGTIKDDVAAMYQYFKRQGVEQQLLEAQDVFANLKQMAEIDPTKNLTQAQIDRINSIYTAAQRRSSTQPIRKISSIDFGPENVVIHYEDGGERTEERQQYVEKSFKPEREVDIKGTALDVSHLDPSKPYLHNNTNADFSDIPEAPELNTKLGNALIKFMREWGDKVGGDYEDLAKDDPSGWFGGISYDKSYRGLNMVKPFKSIWFNPGLLSSDALYSPEAAASETLHIFIHEITHVKARSEGPNFTAELANNYARLRSEGIPVEKFETALANVYAEHWDALNDITSRFQDYNTENSAGSFKSAAALGPERPAETERAGAGAPPVDVSGDERFQEQGRPGAGRTPETDPAAGPIGQILEGQATQGKPPQLMPATQGGEDVFTRKLPPTSDPEFESIFEAKAARASEIFKEIDATIKDPILRQQMKERYRDMDLGKEISDKFGASEEKLKESDKDLDELRGVGLRGIEPDGRQLMPATDSPEFKNWFGDSKVVDEEGKPKVVYHGTNQPITSFNELRRGASTQSRSSKQAFFFTDNPDVANDYAQMAGRRTVANVETHEQQVAQLKANVDRLEEEARRTGNWGPYEAAIEAWENHEIGAVRAPDELGQSILPVYLSMKNPEIVDYKGERAGNLKAGDLEDVINRAKADGRDGVIFKNLVDAASVWEPADHYAVFDANQIKSSIGNRGTFDPTQADISMMPATGMPKIIWMDKAGNLSQVKDHEPMAARITGKEGDEAYKGMFDKGYARVVIDHDGNGMRIYYNTTLDQAPSNLTKDQRNAIQDLAFEHKGWAIDAGTNTRNADLSYDYESGRSRGQQMMPATAREQLSDPTKDLDLSKDSNFHAVNTIVPVKGSDTQHTMVDTDGRRFIGEFDPSIKVWPQLWGEDDQRQFMPATAVSGTEGVTIVKGLKALRGEDLRPEAPKTSYYRPQGDLAQKEGDPKTIKGKKFGVQTYVMYTGASDSSGVMNACPHATRGPGGCIALCLVHNGQGGMPDGTLARINKSRFFNYDRDVFMDKLDREITRNKAKVRAQDLEYAIRLNGTSDIKWEDEGIMQKHPDVTFYDYTKYPEEQRPNIPSNYDITYSYTGDPISIKRSNDWAKNRGMNTAVVFEGGMPAEFLGRPVIDGDVSDARFKDPKGVTVGLHAKGDKALQMAREGTTGFIYKTPPEDVAIPYVYPQTKAALLKEHGESYINDIKDGLNPKYPAPKVNDLVWKRGDHFLGLNEGKTAPDPKNPGQGVMTPEMQRQYEAAQEAKVRIMAKQAREKIEAQTPFHEKGGYFTEPEVQALRGFKKGGVIRPSNGARLAGIPRPRLQRLRGI